MMPTASGRLSARGAVNKRIVFGVPGGDVEAEKNPLECTQYVSVADDKTIDDASSIMRYQQAADHYIESRVWGPRLEITEASTYSTNNPITTCPMTVLHVFR